MLSKNIKELRIEKGLTQAQFAEKIGVSQGAVYFWEKGINEPTAGYLVKMAQIFGISVDELLSYECEKEGGLSENEKKISRYFSLMSPAQQDIVLNIVEEFVKK